MENSRPFYVHLRPAVGSSLGGWDYDALNPDTGEVIAERLTPVCNREPGVLVAAHSGLVRYTPDGTAQLIWCDERQAVAVCQ